MCAGGLAGQLTWMSSYPLDVIKSRIQCEKHRKLSIYTAAAELYRETGSLRAFYRGLTPCLIRAFPCNACIFLVYDSIISAVNS